MQENIILDEIVRNQEVMTRLKAQQKKLLIADSALTLLNMLFFAFFFADDPGSKTNIETAIYGCLIGFTLIGFLLGTLVAIIPYKGLPYRKKYLRASLICLVVLQGFIGLMFLISKTLQLLTVGMNAN